MKQKDKTNDEKDTNDLSSTGDESEDGQSSNTHKDQDSDVSFENDTEEEIDTREIEEEDCIEYIKRSTIDAMEKMKMRRFDTETRLTKNELETDAENSNTTEWEMVDESCRLEPRTQLKNAGPQIDWETKKQMGRRHQRIPQTNWGRGWKSDWKQQPYQ